MKIEARGVFFITFVFITGSSYANENRCGNKWTKPTNSKKYYLTCNKQMTWLEARHTCLDMNSDLVTSNSWQEQEWMARIHAKNLESTSWWTGLIKGTRGEWTWVDGTSYNSTVSQWEEWEPSGGKRQQCGYLTRPRGFKQSACDDKMCFFCQSGPNALKSLPVPFSYSSFEIYSDNVTWKDAYRQCRKRGWTMVSVRSWQDKGVVNYYLLHDSRNSCSGWWLDHRTIPDTWLWSSNVTGTNTTELDTNGGDEENCVEMSNGLLNDVSCMTKLPFACEKRTGLHTEPPRHKHRGLQDKYATSGSEIVSPVLTISILVSTMMVNFKTSRMLAF